MTFEIRDAGLRFPRARERRARTTGIVLHHPHAHWSVQRVHEHHLSLGWNGIGYNFYISLLGDITSGRGMEFVGSHTNPPAGTNSTMVGIACEGRYHDMDRVMPDVQFNALVWLLRHLRDIYGDIPIFGHRELAATACPGQFFPLDEARTLQFRGTENTNSEEVNDLAEEQVRKIVREELRGNGTKVSGWAEEDALEIIAAEISDGTRPGGAVTREEAWTMLARLWRILRGTDA